MKDKHNYCITQTQMLKGEKRVNTLQLVISNEVVEMEIKEYKGQRVVTFRDVDNLHRRSVGTASRNFKTNRKHFIEGEDYFVIQPDQKDEIRPLQIPNRGLTILTESGYLMLVKSFTDNLAWQVQRQLVKAYFKVKQSHDEQIVPTSQEDIMIFALQNQKEMKQRLELLEKENRKLALIVDNEIILTKHQKAMIQQAVNRRQGELNREGYTQAHFQGIYTTLKTHFDVPSYSEIKRVDFDKALNIVAGWYPKKAEEQAQ